MALTMQRLKLGERLWAIELILRAVGVLVLVSVRSLHARFAGSSISPHPIPAVLWSSSWQQRPASACQSGSRCRLKVLGCSGSCPCCPARGFHEEFKMTDLTWLVVLGGLFLLTLAYARLCDKA